MTQYCAKLPLPAPLRVNRSFGVGFNASRTRTDQLHAGIDFAAVRGAPVRSPLRGIVAKTTRNAQPTAGMGGYGNGIVLQHDVVVPGLPSPFWTFWAHLDTVAPLAVGDSVEVGQVLGTAGNTTNGRFPGMPVHLHMEVRRSARFSGNSYDADTINPEILYSALGFDYTGAREEASGHTPARLVGGELVLRAQGPSDCSQQASVGMRTFPVLAAAVGVAGFVLLVGALA